MTTKVTIELSEEMDVYLSEIAKRLGMSRAEALEFSLGVLLDTLIEDDDGGGDDGGGDGGGEPIPLENAA